MSQADIQMLRTVYDAVGRKDWDVARSNSLPDFELKLPEGDPLSATYHGGEARKWFEDLLEPFEEVVAEPEKFFERGDQIAVIAVMRLRPRGSSAVVEIRGGHVWTIRDGKLARAKSFGSANKPSKAWVCRSKTLTPTPDAAGYWAGDVSGERRAVSPMH